MTNLSEHRQWEKNTSLKRVDELREQWTSQGKPFSEHMLAQAAATYTNTNTKLVLGWMKGK